LPSAFFFTTPPLNRFLSFPMNHEKELSSNWSPAAGLYVSSHGTVNSENTTSPDPPPPKFPCPCFSFFCNLTLCSRACPLSPSLNLLSSLLSFLFYMPAAPPLKDAYSMRRRILSLLTHTTHCLIQRPLGHLISPPNPIRPACTCGPSPSSNPPVYFPP